MWLQLAQETTSAPISALVWLIIPAAALVGGLAYAYWVIKLKARYENQVNRSVGNFRRFQDSFKSADSQPRIERASENLSNQPDA